MEGVSVGDRAVVNPSSPCARCRYCLEDRPNLCADMRFLGSAARSPHVQGGLREQMVAPARQIIVVPPQTPYHIAAFAEPLAVALHAVSQAGPLIGRRVLVCGSGVIGALVALCARQAGALSVTTTDLADEPLTLLRAIGAADETINVRTAPERIEALAPIGGPSTSPGRPSATPPRWRRRSPAPARADGWCRSARTRRGRSPGP